MKTETIVGLFILFALGIFFYMTFFLGIFRVDRMRYQSYTVHFDDVSGLEKKADIKIAGVKVGWVESIHLDKGDEAANVKLMILKKYKLYDDARAIIRQESLLGTKFLEMVPGDSSNTLLSGGNILPQIGKSAPSMDEILHKVQTIATHVEDITGSLRSSIGGVEGKEQFRSMVDNFSSASERIASFTSVLDRTLSQNEGSLNHLIVDLKDFVHDMKTSFPDIKDSVQKATDSFEDAALQARDGFKNLGSVAEKIDQGKGTIGKLINDDETYHDLRVTAQGLKNYFSKVEAMNIVFDSHGEYMYKPAENVNFEDAKGYLDVRVHPGEDHFYLLQYVMPQKGIIKREIEEVKWFDENHKELKPSDLIAQGVHMPDFVGTVEKRKRILDKPKLGLQVGKIFRDFAFRVGVFENSAGFGIDFDIPFGTDKFRWVTTIEAFDFKGRDRFDDKRPHLKWLNRLFLLRNIYVAFGADDFISKKNANGFFGAGLRFCDDDVKYLLSSVSGVHH